MQENNQMNPVPDGEIADDEAFIDSISVVEYHE